MEDSSFDKNLGDVINNNPEVQKKEILIIHNMKIQMLTQENMEEQKNTHQTYNIQKYMQVK